MKEIPQVVNFAHSGQYELDEGPAYRFAFTRRRFLETFSGGLAFLLVAGALRDPAAPLGEIEEALSDEIGAWLHIDEAGKVTVYTGKVEVGQNIRTSLAQAVAEELSAPIESVQLVMGDTDLTPYDRGTFGSLTTPQMSPQLRRAAASARELLLDLAAEEWKVDREALSAKDGKIIDRSGRRSAGFGHFAKGRKMTRSIRADIALTPVADWQVSGLSIPKVNGRSFVTGAHRFVSDLTAPGMLHGKVLRSPTFGAKLEQVDLGEAEKIPGVVAVRDGDFVGVAAPDASIATRALAAIRARWRFEPQPSQAELFDRLKNTAREGGGGRGGARASGSVEEGLAAADVQLSQTYTAAYIAHAPLEPRAALARWEADKLTVWTGTQRPFGVREELAQAFGMPNEQVRVIMPDTGSGYGGKHTGEVAIEAARLAKAAGKPVKLVWTRQEEFTWAYFRPAARIEVRAGAAKDGKLTAWSFDTYNPGGSGLNALYETPHRHQAAHTSHSPLRQGSYRALGASVNHFARETHIDELAHAIGMDSLTFRLKNLRDDRLIAVLEAAAKAFGWGGTTLPPGTGQGLACGFEKGGYLATCAEVRVDSDDGTLKIRRITAAFECGAVVNPRHLKSQVEGCVVQGIGGALFESIDFADGKILNPYFSAYRVPRFADVPPIDVVLLNRMDLPPAGGSETPIVAIAPALGNAIFQATGLRLRSLPLMPNGGLKWEKAEKGQG
jgi:nicotinate dehydrogenase subunit B